MENTPEDAHELQIPEQEGIDSSATPRIRLSSLQQRRPRNGNGGNGKGNGDDGGPPPIIVPDIAIQIEFAVLALVSPDTLKQIIKTSLDAPGSSPGSCRGESSTGFNSDVRIGRRIITDVNGTPHDTVAIAIWLQPPTGEREDQARERGLRVTNVLGTAVDRQGGLSETLAWFLNSSMITRLAITNWKPLRFNADGMLDERGPIHITTLSSVTFNPTANAIVTKVDGFSEQTWPAVDFSITLTDTFSTSGGKVVTTTTSLLTTDTTLLTILTVVAAVLSSITLPLAVFFGYEAISAGAASAPSGQGGAGAKIVSRMLPQEILLPATLKMVIAYGRATVGTGGVILAGKFQLPARKPTVRIVGSNQIAGDEESAATDIYSFTYSDALPPLAISWTAGPNATVRTPNACSTVIDFDIGDAKKNSVLQRNIGVTISDADNLSASASLGVEVHVTDENDPPECRHKPWLSQCRE
jgi:hypothetical protein